MVSLVFDYTKLSDKEFEDFLIEIGLERKDIMQTQPGLGKIIFSEEYPTEIERLKYEYE